MNPIAGAPARLRRKPARPMAPPPGGGQVLRFRGGDGGGATRLDDETVVMLGVWIALIPTLMLFLSLVSAYIVRRGLGEGWIPVAMPPLFWLNTSVLVLSGFTVEVARRQARRGARAAGWMALTFLLGAAFLVGQVMAWRAMLAAGITVGSTPHASFLYLLSFLHAVHVVLGVVGLLAATLWPAAGWASVSPRAAVRASAVYWHFLDVAWLGLLSLLVFGS